MAYTVLTALLCLMFFSFGVAIGRRQEPAPIGYSREEYSRLLAAEKLKQDKDLLNFAVAYLSEFKSCPKCHTQHGVIGSHYDCMDIILDYCDHAWHYLNMKTGTFHDLTREQAITKYAEKLSTGWREAA